MGNPAGWRTSRFSPIFAIAVVWTLLILVACWIPARGLPMPESKASRFLIPHFDKIVHFTLFAGFGTLWMLVAMARNRPIAVFAAGVILAIVSELGQGFKIVGREPNLLDTLADSAGACAGVAMVVLLRRIREGRLARNAANSPG